jgi:hypothetical protein
MQNSDEAALIDLPIVTLEICIKLDQVQTHPFIRGYTRLSSEKHHEATWATAVGVRLSIKRRTKK